MQQTHQRNQACSPQKSLTNLRCIYDKHDHVQTATSEACELSKTCKPCLFKESHTTDIRFLQVQPVHILRIRRTKNPESRCRVEFDSLGGEATPCNYYILLSRPRRPAIREFPVDLALQLQRAVRLQAPPRILAMLCRITLRLCRNVEHTIPERTIKQLPECFLVPPRLQLKLNSHLAPAPPSPRARGMTHIYIYIYIYIYPRP